MQEGMVGDALWRSLVEALPDFVLVLDSSSEIAFANNKLPPLARGPVMGKKVGDCLNAVAASTIQRVVERARLDLAVLLNGANERAEATDQLIYIIKKMRTWNEEAARKQLVKFFEAWGLMDKVTVAARRKLYLPQ